MDRVTLRVVVGDQDRNQLVHWVRSGTTPHRLVMRSRIVLLAARGVSIRRTAAELGVSVRTVALWRRRYTDGGAQALVRDAPGRGRRSLLEADLVQPILAAYRSETTPRSVRQLAASFGLSRSTIHRLLQRAASDG